MNLTELTPENKKGYKDMKKSFNDFLDDYYEYLQIISEFKTNEYLQNIHNDIAFMERYRIMYENARDELNETKKKLEKIQKIVNRGDTSE